MCVVCKTLKITFQKLAFSVFFPNIVSNLKHRENNIVKAQCYDLQTFPNFLVFIVFSYPSGVAVSPLSPLAGIRLSRLVLP